MDGNGLRRAALVVGLVMLAASVTGVATPAAKTALPKPLVGKWRDGGQGVLIVVKPTGKVTVIDFVATFSHVTAHKLTIGGAPLCSGKKGTYHWKIASDKLELKKIHDTCKPEAELAGTWSRA